MRNPWLKKNPLLSMWLSGANAAMGYGRSRALSEMHRQSAAMSKQYVHEWMRLWTGSAKPSSARMTATTRRKRR
jgi:hypothetical protein